MSYAGYLLKINGVVFPNRYIKHNSYQSTPDSLIDDDSYRDADGIMRRKVLPHKVTAIEFSTPHMNLNQKKALQLLIPTRIKLAVEYWNDETNTYAVGDFYIPDVTYSIYSSTENDIIYNPISYKFIKY